MNSLQASAETILADLVSFPSLSGTPNRAIVGYIKEYFEDRQNRTECGKSYKIDPPPPLVMVTGLPLSVRSTKNWGPAALP